MLQMQIRFDAVRAFVLVVRIFGRIGGGLASGRRRATWNRRQNPSPALLAYNMNRIRLLVLYHLGMIELRLVHEAPVSSCTKIL
jgi:hypothetical protein